MWVEFLGLDEGGALVFEGGLFFGESVFGGFEVMFSGFEVVTSGILEGGSFELESEDGVKEVLDVEVESGYCVVNDDGFLFDVVSSDKEFEAFWSPEFLLAAHFGSLLWKI